MLSPLSLSSYLLSLPLPFFLSFILFFFHLFYNISFLSLFFCHLLQSSTLRWNKIRRFVRLRLKFKLIGRIHSLRIENLLVLWGKSGKHIVQLVRENSRNVENPRNIFFPVNRTCSSISSTDMKRSYQLFIGKV